ncbi:MAG: 50S ribosomal protein L16 [Candidatus Hodarchaeaceae archaeon]|nr:50S ribosomal protein L16 [Candidatus Hodarchaeaceae archaeon]
MPLRPARSYRHFSGPAYTRREYVKGVPGIRVTFFDMGNPKGDFPVELSLVSQETGQIRHNALEAARVAANRLLEVKAGKDNYHLKLRVYPHQVLRENPMAMGAGADRISDGMRQAFGRPIGTAARVTAGQKLMTVRSAKEFAAVNKEALRRASLKLSLPCRIVVEKGQEFIQ